MYIHVACTCEEKAQHTCRSLRVCVCLRRDTLGGRCVYVHIAVGPSTCNVGEKGDGKERRRRRLFVVQARVLCSRLLHGVVSGSLSTEEQINRVVVFLSVCSSSPPAEGLSTLFLSREAELDELRAEVARLRVREKKLEEETTQLKDERTLLRAEVHVRTLGRSDWLGKSPGSFSPLLVLSSTFSVLLKRGHPSVDAQRFHSSRTSRCSRKERGFWQT